MMDRRIFYLKEILENELKHQWRNAEMAARLNISTPHLQQLFKKHLSTTPNAFLTNARLERAAELLLSTKFLSVKEVAYEVGFTDDSRSTRTFKKKYSLTPSEFCKRFWDSKQSPPPAYAMNNSFRQEIIVFANK